MDGQRKQLARGATFNSSGIDRVVDVSTKLSIGNIIQLVRGGVLIGNASSAPPEWRNIDPLAVLSSPGDEDYDDTLEVLVERNKEDPMPEQSPDKGQLID